MEINIGDKVKFLDEVGGGIVVKILSKTMALIKDNSNFEYQVPIKELLVVEKAVAKTIAPTPTPKDETIKKTKKEEEKHYYKNSDISNIDIAIIRNKEENNFDFYLVNDSDYSFYYNIILFGKNKKKQIKHDYLEENSIAEINKITAEEINNSKKIVVQILFYNHPKKIYHSQIEEEINIVAINFWQEHNYKDSGFFDEKTYTLNIFKEDLKKIEKNYLAEEKVEKILKEDNIEDKSKRYSARKEKETIVVDLHINNLIDSVLGLSNAMILEIQMKAFHKALTDAIIDKNVKKIVFIHGNGSGRLKNDVRNAITNIYKLKFEDASYQEYGFGATMVLL